MFLTDSEIKDLTGYKTHKGQVNWLRQNGITYLVAHDGKPRVMIKHLEAVMGISIQPEKKRTQPDRDALRGHMGIA